MLLLSFRSGGYPYLEDLVEAARVESEAVLTTIGVYEDFPNVYRMKDILMLVIKSPFQYYYQP